MVIADTRAIAEDAVALIEIEVAEEPPVVTIAQAGTSWYGPEARITTPEASAYAEAHQLLSR